MVTLIGLSGSLRRGSYNSAVLRAAAALMPADSALKIESIAGIPLYDGEVEAASGVPAAVTRLKDAIAPAGRHPARFRRQARRDRGRVSRRFRHHARAGRLAAGLQDAGRRSLFAQPPARLAR